MAESLSLVPSTTIPHLYNGVLILQAGDGYWNASAMCRANGKLWADYWRTQTTQEYASALSRSMGIPIDLLTRTVMTGPNDSRGTWVHQRIALHLAQWCNATFAVMVTGWVEELWTRGRVELPGAPPQNHVPGAWSQRIAPGHQGLKRHLVLNCPPGSWAVLTAAIGETLETEDVLLRHCLPIENHNLPEGSIGIHFGRYREGQPWAGQVLKAPLVLPKWVKATGEDFVAQVNVYGAEELMHFDQWLYRIYFPRYLPNYLERKFPRRRFGLATASAADNSSVIVTGQRAVLPPATLRAIDNAGGVVTATHGQLGRRPQQGTLFE